jgi:copper transport protein
MARLRAVLVALAVALGLLAALPGAASAHAALESSSPAANSILEEAPAAIVLDFDEPVDAAVSSIELFDETRGSIEVSGVESPGDPSILTSSVPDIDDGLYVVVWRATSADGHVIDGAFTFQIGTGSSGVDVDELVDDVTAASAPDPMVDRLMTVWRFLSLVGMVGLFGVALIGTAAHGPPRSRRIAQIAWVSAAVGALGTFAFYGAQIVGGGIGDAFRPVNWGDVAGTRTGQAILVRFVLLAVLLVLIVQWNRRAPWRSVVGAVALVGIAVTHAVAGHASAAEPQWLYVANDTLHQVAIGLWVGGLFLVATAGSAFYDDTEAVGLVHRFSTTSLVAVPVMVLTGFVQTVELAGGLGDLTATRWGQLLLMKVVVVVVLVVLGAIGRTLLRHDGPAGIRRGVAIEAALGLVVIALAAALVAQPPQAASSGRVVSTTITAGGVIADVTVTPGRVGANELHMVFSPPGGNLEPVLSVQARMSLPEADLPDIPVDVVAEGTNHYSGTITLPEPGAWVLEIVVETAPASTVLLRTTVDIPG